MAIYLHGGFPQIVITVGSARRENATRISEDPQTFAGQFPGDFGHIQPLIHDSVCVYDAA